MSAIGRIKNVVRYALYRTGVLGHYHRLRNRNALTVLMFHRVLPKEDPAWPMAEREFTFSKDGFGLVLDFIRLHYNVVTLWQVRQAALGRAVLPPCPALITFDDGWRDTVEHAMPELLSRSLPAVLFATSDALCEPEGQRWWQDALVSALAHEGAHLRFCEAAGWRAESALASGFVHRLAAWFAMMSPSQRRDVIEQVAPGEWAAVHGRQMMTLDDLKAWQAAGFEFGGHGCSHAPLSLFADPMGELQRSWEWVVEQGAGVVSMSFPHGSMSPELVDAARQVGFQMVFTSRPELVAWDQGAKLPDTLGRIHLPENTWTCADGKISGARLATYLFFRTVARDGRLTRA